MRTAMRGMYPNLWQCPDVRFEGLLKIANAINTSFDLAGASSPDPDIEFAPSLYPVLTPLRLALLMKVAAQHIEELT